MEYTSTSLKTRLPYQCTDHVGDLLTLNKALLKSLPSPTHLHVFHNEPIRNPLWWANTVDLDSIVGGGALIKFITSYSMFVM